MSETLQYPVLSIRFWLKNEKLNPITYIYNVSMWGEGTLTLVVGPLKKYFFYVCLICSYVKTEIWNLPFVIVEIGANSE